MAPAMHKTTPALALAACGLLAFGCACQWEPKVPIVDIGAGFVIADATWFEEEQTLFVFYRVDAEQGLSDESQIELTLRTDEVELPFTPLEELEFVHEHVAADCGVHTLCGSASIRVELLPREVELRLRYHRDGALTLSAPLEFHVVRTGPPATNRSAIVYGVFNEDNTRVQWRLRHQFPAIRNTDAQRLGLRRLFQVDAAGHGSLPATPLQLDPDNPYGYGFAAVCPVTFDDLGFSAVETNARAAFQPEALPLPASTSAQVCGRARVSDALGPFVTAALAQKNPEVAPAFPALATPIRENVQLRFMFKSCSAELDDVHFEMQQQRLLMNDTDTVCIDDVNTDGFVLRLAQRLQDAIDERRVENRDMVLVIGLNRADNARATAERVEAALALVVDEESDKSSPRLTGAFVFDSNGYAASSPLVNRNVLWCPSTFGGGDLDSVDNVSLRSCAVQANSEVVLGPVRLASAPILPTRAQYLTFIERYSQELAGSMQSLSFRAPTRTPLSDNVPLEPFGVATFFNNEAITPLPTDAFSYCVDDDPGIVVFRVAALPDELFPLAVLPDLHLAAPQPRYALGLAWDFPFLLTLEYETFAAGAVTVEGLTVPFGLASPAEAFLGSALWLQDSFDLSTVLLRCDRFCAHPTFDSAGVYNVQSPFADTFRSQCYVPRFPEPPGAEFPLDP